MTKLLLTLSAFAVSLASQSVAEELDDKASVPVKALVALKDRMPPFLQHVEVHGDSPTVICVPIIHDGPMNHLSSTNLDDCESILAESQSLAGHLYSEYGVRNILLEGCGKPVADHYNRADRKGKKLSFGNTKMVTFRVWAEILNGNRWNLAPTGESPQYGPLTKLGSEYSRRIQGALATAKDNGWFKTREGFVENQAAFSKMIGDIAEEYNEKHDEILEDDPKLKKEYAITVSQRNEAFITNITAAEGPGIIVCGAGHLQDLKAQFAKADISYMVAVPKTLDWPIAEKGEEDIFKDMLKLGCQLKGCNLRFGDGTSAKIKIPIK